MSEDITAERRDREGEREREREKERERESSAGVFTFNATWTRQQSKARQSNRSWGTLAPPRAQTKQSSPGHACSSASSRLIHRQINKSYVVAKIPLSRPRPHTSAARFHTTPTAHAPLLPLHVAYPPLQIWDGTALELVSPPFPNNGDLICSLLAGIH